MVKLRFLIGLLAFILCSNAVAKGSLNPFAKAKTIDFDNAEWVIEGKTATKSGSDSGTFYHLFYDKKQLRLRMTGSAEDSEATAKKYEQLSIEDVQIDGKRLPIFHWCLKNQQRHARFLQQGLSVRNNICANNGAKGAFVMRLNIATVESLKKGKKLTFVIRPFRSSIKVNFDISDFVTVVERLSNVGRVVAKEPRETLAKKCEVTPPKGFAELGGVVYICGDETSKAEANAIIAMVIKEEQDIRRKKEKARKKQEEEAYKKELAEKIAREKKLEETKLVAEKAVLATSTAQQEFIGSEIANKMVAMCKKKWAVGEHRCYCEKYLEYAPAGIRSDPSC